MSNLTDPYFNDMAIGDSNQPVGVDVDVDIKTGCGHVA